MKKTHAKQAMKRAAVHARNRPDCHFWIASADHWEPVESVGGVLHHPDGRPVDESSTCEFAVAYPNGQLLDGELGELGPPDGTRFLDEQGIDDDCCIPLAGLEPGASILRIAFGVCDAFPNDPDYYSTSLTNISDQPVRVESFSPAGLTSLFGFRQRLHTGRRYSAEEFANWYGAPNALVDQGQTVTDFNNWGAPPLGWVYRCRLASGTRVVAGALLREPI